MQNNERKSLFSVLIGAEVFLIDIPNNIIVYPTEMTFYDSVHNYLPSVQYSFLTSLTPTFYTQTVCPSVCFSLSPPTHINEYISLSKVSTDIDRLLSVWKSDLSDKIKQNFFQAAFVSILL